MRLSFWKGLGKWGAFPVLVVLAAGCGASTGSVSGKVTTKGAPVTGGNLTFVSTENKPSASVTINPDGTYTIPKIQAGTYKICVDTESLKPTGTVPKGAIGYKPPPGSSAGGYDPSGSTKSGTYVHIPEKYSKPESTDLTYTVKSGVQEHDIKVD